jgi:hypothetical protein
VTPIPSFIPLTPLPASPEGYRGLATDRVLRHFAVTCAERLDTPHKSQHFNDLLAACRNFADGFISRKSLDDYREAHLRTPWLTNANSAAHNSADYFAYEAAYISAYWSSLGSPATDLLPQSCLFTLHIGGIVSSAWPDESIAVSRWSPDWRTEATANLAEQIAAGNLGLAGVLHDDLYDLGCDNEVWLRILRECPEIIRPGMWFWDRLRGIQDSAEAKSVGRTWPRIERNFDPSVVATYSEPRINYQK